MIASILTEISLYFIKTLLLKEIFLNLGHLDFDKISQPSSPMSLMTLSYNVVEKVDRSVLYPEK